MQHDSTLLEGVSSVCTLLSYSTRAGCRRESLGRIAWENDSSPLAEMIMYDQKLIRAEPS